VRKCIYSFVVLAVFPACLAAQQSPPGPDAPPPLQPATAIMEKPRVFVTDSESWESSGSAGGSNGSFAAESHGGARPQTAEIIKTFGERCSEVVVNNRQSIADYIVVLDHEGGKGYLRHRNKVAVFEHLSGDVVMSKSTLSLGGSVEDACNGINAHWTAHGQEILTAKRQSERPAAMAVSPIPATLFTPQPSASQASVLIDSIPLGADIEIDGGFVGNTPSSIQLAPGNHQIAVKRKGFVTWTKTLNVTGGSIHLNAELEQAAPSQ